MLASSTHLLSKLFLLQFKFEVFLATYRRISPEILNYPKNRAM